MSEGPAPGAALRLLLVEDDPGDALLVREWLAGHAVEVQWAPTLAAAEPLAAHAQCVLLDLGLPDAVGLAGVARMLRRAPDAAVVVLAGRGDGRAGAEALAYGAQDYLVKGDVTADSLIRAIRYAVGRRRADATERALRDERRRTGENQRLERGLLPRPLLRDSGVRLVSRYQPGGARGVLGGDFYDAVEAPDGAVHLVVGDVTGHGPDAAALGVALRIAWRTLTLADTSPTDVLPLLHQVLVHERPEAAILTSVCAAVVHPDRRRLTYRLAGHPAPLLHAGARWSALPQRNGPLLGLAAPARHPGVAVDLGGRGARLLLYTDGVTEGRRAPADRRRLEREGLLALLDALPAPAAGDAARRLDQLVAQVTARNGGPITDDLALVGVDIPPATPPRPRRPSAARLPGLAPG